MAETTRSIAEKLGLEDPIKFIKGHNRKRGWRGYGLTTKRICEALAKTHNDGSEVIFIRSSTLTNSQRIAAILKGYLAKLGWIQIRVVVVRMHDSGESFLGIANYTVLWDHY